MLANFVSVFGILLVTLFVVLGICFMIDKVSAWFIAKDKPRATVGPYMPLRDMHSLHPNPFQNYSFPDYSATFSHQGWKIDILEKRLEDINVRLTDIEQNYMIDSDDDESLIDMVKRHEKDIEDLKYENDNRKEDIDVLKMHYKECRQIANIAWERTKDIEQKITVGDDPNRMNITTVTASEG